MYRKLVGSTTNVQTMIDILDCNLKEMNAIELDIEDLESPIEFRSDWGTEFTCRLRDIQYTYKFCKRLLEMCRDAGYIK